MIALTATVFLLSDPFFRPPVYLPLAIVYFRLSIYLSSIRRRFDAWASGRFPKSERIAVSAWYRDAWLEIFST
jgi:hypothetical protein